MTDLDTLVTAQLAESVERALRELPWQTFIDQDTRTLGTHVARALVREGWA